MRAGYIVSLLNEDVFSFICSQKLTSIDYFIANVYSTYVRSNTTTRPLMIDGK